MHTTPFNFNDVLDLTPAQIIQAKEAISSEFAKRPPTIGVVGASGVGKSLTINAMFNTNLPTSNVVACTKAFITCEVPVYISNSEWINNDVFLRIVDAPGLGEDVKMDPQYLSKYRNELPICDVILWVLTARNRALALDQFYVQELSQFSSKIVFGINQIDLIEPLNWNYSTNSLSAEQSANLEIIEQDRGGKLFSTLGHEAAIVSYSAKHSWGLQELFATLLETCPEDRAWIFQLIKNFSPFKPTPTSTPPKSLNDSSRLETKGNDE